jgi:hypothetical protein
MISGENTRERERGKENTLAIRESKRGKERDREKEKRREREREKSTVDPRYRGMKSSSLRDSWRTGTSRAFVSADDADDVNDGGE